MCFDSCIVREQWNESVWLMQKGPDLAAFTAAAVMREMLAAALDAAAWILLLTWPSTTSNSHTAVTACTNTSDTLTHLHSTHPAFTLGLNIIFPKVDFFSSFFSSAFGAGGSSGLAAASRVLLLDASTWCVRGRSEKTVLYTANERTVRGFKKMLNWLCESLRLNHQQRD